MNVSTLEKIARALVAPEKGILAADESFSTIERRFKDISLTSTEENRRSYRELLFTTPAIGKFLSGVILYDETIRQQASNREPMIKVLEKQNLIPGIKVDRGAKELALFPGETITEGLDGLRSRLLEYRELGARFTKWRAVIRIGDGLPTRHCIEANAHALACFAALSQEAELVPIVEPEVLMDGDHTIQHCEDTTGEVLRVLFDALWAHRVALEGVLLKTNMIVPGTKASETISTEQIAEATVRCLRRFVPAAVPGIVFLSGGQTEVQASLSLNAISRIGNNPWELSFSYGRALQASALKIWKGNAANVQAAQRAFYHRARCNSLARCGKYTGEVEKQTKEEWMKRSA